MCESPFKVRHKLRGVSDANPLRLRPRVAALCLENLVMTPWFLCRRRCRAEWLPLGHAHLPEPLPQHLQPHVSAPRPAPACTAHRAPALHLAPQRQAGERRKDAKSDFTSSAQSRILPRGRSSRGGVPGPFCAVPVLESLPSRAQNEDTVVTIREGILPPLPGLGIEPTIDDFGNSARTRWILRVCSPAGRCSRQHRQNKQAPLIEGEGGGRAGGRAFGGRDSSFS